MPLIEMDVPTIHATVHHMNDFLKFVYRHEQLLKYYGAIKIIPPSEFNNVFKVKRVKLTSLSTIQQVTQLNQDRSIYSISNIPCSKQEKIMLPSPMNEVAFWQLLSHSHTQQKISSVSIMHDKSFFLKRIHRTAFNIHLLPERSLLKFCDKQLRCQFVPSLIRAHGPGAIMPLASARQRLSSFHYHHEGGARHWHIIPASERDALECATLLCLDHGCTLIDPIIFDKYEIRYHRLIQQPNEIIILAAGTLSQSFTEDACCSESIDFALPSWLDDGHANAQISCNCRPDIVQSTEMIDVKLFDRSAIQQYIRTHLNTVNNNKSSSTTDKPNLELCVSPNDSLTFTDQLSSSTYQLPYSNISSLETKDTDDNEHQRPLVASLSNTSPNMSNDSVSLATSSLSQSSLESLDDLYDLSSLEHVEEGRIETNNQQLHQLSFEEILDLLSTPPSTVLSEDIQTKKEINDQKQIASYSSFHHCSKREVAHQNGYVRKNKHTKMSKNNNRTLFIRNMSTEVTKANIYKHFIGSVKVTIKQSYLPPYLNYAFVQHRTCLQAEKNQKRSLNRLLFGIGCQVEYAGKNLRHDGQRRNFDGWSIVVRQIPMNVTEQSLRNLFVGCRYMKYIPARYADNKTSRSIFLSKNKVLLGYAFLYYTNTDEAANIVRNSNGFKIDGQSLMISFFDSIRTKPKEKEEMESDFDLLKYSKNSP